MAGLIDTAAGTVFLGAVEDSEAVSAAARMAAGCSGFSADDDDECYVGEGPSCFDCRARRWVSDGFTCMRGLLER